MSEFTLNFFKGMRPRITATKLKVGEAQNAENCVLGSGDIEPIIDKSDSATLNIEAGTIYRYKDDSGDLWFEWIATVDVAQGPIKNDSYNRVYYTGALSGDGKPKFTTNTLADGGGGGPYPEDWLYMGVPQPESKCTTSVVQLPEDKDAGERLVANIAPEKYIIDQVFYTFHPGVGTDNSAWQLNSGATGGILFNISAGSSFRVTEVINNNKVKLESATEPGILLRTVNSDKTTTTDWAPMDETGSTKTADFIGWRIPADTEVTIAGHGLAVGDTIVCSRVNFAPMFFPGAAETMYEQGWAADSSYYEGGFTRTEVRDAAISPAASLDGTKFFMLGSFYYDVDRASSTTSELEDRTYVYTYVNDFGEEGPPSDPSEVTPQLDGADVTITGMSLPPTIGYNISSMRLYRSNSTEAGTEYQFVKEFDLSTTTTDDVLSEDLGEVIPSTTWDAPPSGMKGITDMPNGMMVGFSGKTVHFAEPYFPHAWPADYDQAIAYDIVGLAAFGNAVAVMTTGWPYIITGTHPRNASVRPIKANYACVSAKSIASGGDNVYYATNEGLVEIGARGLRLCTESFLDKSDWTSYSPSTMVGSFYDGRYHGFWGFDATAVEDEIVAEVSGTITAAGEEDIRAGGNTVILTLTNDLWVASGASFNAVRQDIIDGISDTATSPQTNGWDNIVRDTALGVGNVVRTSDTVVTITLPAAVTYGIDSAETIQPTIPASALQVSNAAVNTGSTFKIEYALVGTTANLTGTLGGAAEADVVTGGNTVIITLIDDTWITTANGFNDYRATLALGLKSSTDEKNGWNDEVPNLIPVANVVRTSDAVVTITLPAVPDYSVTSNESITALIPHEMLATQSDVDVTSGNSLGILATGVASALFSGTATASMTENEVVAGGKVLDITLTNDTWIAAGTGPIGTTAQSEALRDALTAQSSPTLGWNNVVVPGIEVAGDLTRVSSTVARFTFDAESTYQIDDPETITLTVPGAVLTSGDAIICANSFGVTAQNPISCVVSGTVTESSIEEDVIIAGGETIVLTLTGDTWKAAGTGPIGSTANTQALINNIDSAQAEAAGWDAVVKAGIETADVVRTSDTVCTITLDPEASYSITAQETITVTVPTDVLNISASSVVASPTFTVDVDVPATCTVTGTADGASDDDIVNGGKTVILTISNDTWVASGATFNAQRQNIIDGLDAATSPATGWNNVIRDAIDVSTCVRTSDTVVTITLPAAATYDVGADEAITVTVPASALTQSTSNVTGDVTVDILDIFDTFVMVGAQQQMDAPTRKAYIVTAQDSFTSWTETVISEDTSNTNSNKGFGIDYNPTDSLWLAFFRDPVTNYEETMWSSADDGASWTKRHTTSFSTTRMGRWGWMFYHVDADIAFCGGDASDEEYDFHYSTDGGLNWSNSNTPYSNRTVGAWYPDGERVYYHGAARAVSRPYQHNNGSTWDYYYMYSPDLSTPSNVSNAWTEASLSFGGYGDSRKFIAAEGGDGYTYMFLADGGAGSPDILRISRVAHGGTTESYIGSISDIDFGSIWRWFGASSPTKTIVMTDEGYLIKCATSGITSIGNWTYPTDTSVGTNRIASGVDFTHLIYDPGNTSPKEGLGWIAIGTKDSDTKGVIYTSDDGETWTLRHTSTITLPAFDDTLNNVASKYHQAYT
jgi:hypothetical protein